MSQSKSVNYNKSTTSSYVIQKYIILWRKKSLKLLVDNKPITNDLKMIAYKGVLWTILNQSMWYCDQ